MDAYKELSTRLAQLGRPKGQALYQGIVKSVEGKACTVEIEGLDIPDIRLRASTTKEGEEFLLIPQVGSAVIVGSLSGDLSDLLILSLDKVDKFIMHGGRHGGLVLARELTEKLNALEGELNDLKQIFTSWVTIPNDGGASLKTAVANWAGKQLTPTKTKDIENPKIRQ